MKVRKRALIKDIQGFDRNVIWGVKKDDFIEL